MNDDKTKASAAEAFAAYLAAHGLRRTPERIAVLMGVLSMNGHFVIDQLIKRMADGEISVSRGTVYNTVGLLLDSGLLRSHSFAGGSTQYEVVAGSRTNHHHLVCTHCGKVREVSDATVERVVKSLHYDTFHPEYFALSIYGICSRCQRRMRRNRH